MYRYLTHGLYITSTLFTTRVVIPIHCLQPELLPIHCLYHAIHNCLQPELLPTHFFSNHDIIVTTVYNLAHCDGLNLFKNSVLLTLGAHAQRGLQYSVCLSLTHCVTVCVCNTPDPGLSSTLNAEISTSTKCKGYALHGVLTHRFSNNTFPQRYS